MSIERDHRSHRGQADPDYPAPERHRDPATCGEHRGQERHHNQGRQSEGHPSAQGKTKPTPKTKSKQKRPTECNGQKGHLQANEGALGEAEGAARVDVDVRNQDMVTLSPVLAGIAAASVQGRVALGHRQARASAVAGTCARRRRPGAPGAVKRATTASISMPASSCPRASGSALSACAGTRCGRPSR